MKKILNILTAILIFSVLINVVNAVSTGGGLSGMNIETEKFKPLVWLCDNRVVNDDNVEKGRYNPLGDPDALLERINNYAFEGESIAWDILAMDKNGAGKIKDVFVSLGPERNARRHYTVQVTKQRIRTLLNGTNVTEFYNVTEQRLSKNDIQANCQRTGGPAVIPASCNARILEEQLRVFNPETMVYYTCTFTVEPTESMHGQHWVTLEIVDLDEQFNVVDEPEYWFMNPTIAVDIEGSLDFGTVRPGTGAYSDSVLVMNGAEQGSGVLLDMFISGTDFYDPSSSGAKCPNSNVLKLGDGDSDCDSKDNFCYYAAKGAYSTAADPRSDAEGYVGIIYGDHFTTSFYNNAEIIREAGGPSIGGLYYRANILSPGSKIPITFRLNLPEPCNGDFSTGQIFFWAEAI